MAFENLTERLQNVFKNLRKKGKITESDIQEATKEIRLALLEADVALPVVKDFIKKRIHSQKITVKTTFSHLSLKSIHY